MSENYVVGVLYDEALDSSSYASISPATKIHFSDRLLTLANETTSFQELARFDLDVLKKLPTRKRRSEERKAKTLANSAAFQTEMAQLLGARLPVGSTQDSETCLVLSGGAFKGSFEVGCLAYLKNLWQVMNITAIVGTSVGSVNALAVAQEGETGIDRLIDLWLDLCGDGDMYVLHPTVKAADAFLKSAVGKGIEDIMKDSNVLNTLQSSIVAQFADELALGTAGIGAFAVGGAVGGPVGMGLVGLGALLFGSSVASTSNQAAQIITAVENAVNNIMRAPGMYEFQPLRLRLAGNLQSNALGGNDLPKLRVAMVSLEDGEIYYFTENLKLLKGHADVSKAKKVWDLASMSPSRANIIIEAIIASSATPVFFPAVTLAEVSSQGAVKNRGHFVDGGIKETLPLRAAFDMNYKRVFAILTSSKDIDPWSFKGTGLPPFSDVALRTLPIMLDEISDSDLAEGDRRTGIDLVRLYPFVEAYRADAFSVEPGLIRINMAYGFMRTWGATLDERGKHPSNADIVIAFLLIERIVELRRELWWLETKAVIPVPQLTPSSPGYFVIPTMLQEIREKKAELVGLVDDLYDVDPDILPKKFGSEPIKEWWLNFEHHKENTHASRLNGKSAFKPQPVTGNGTRENQASVPVAPVSRHQSLN